MRSGTTAALSVAALLGMAGCTSPSSPSSSPPTPTPAATPSPAPATSAPARRLCADGFPNPSAPAYAGPGPHPAVLDVTWSSDWSRLVYQPWSQYSLPAAWRGYKGYEPDPSRVRLIVCLTDLRQQGEKPIGLCEYDTVAADVYPASYTFEVYEAKTGRTVTTFTIRGDQSARSSCPATVQHRIGYRLDIAQAVKAETLHRRLRPFITGRAR